MNIDELSKRIKSGEKWTIDCAEPEPPEKSKPSAGDRLAWLGDPARYGLWTIDYADDDPALLQDLSRGEWIALALAFAICGVVGFVLGFGVASWIN